MLMKSFSHPGFCREKPLSERQTLPSCTPCTLQDYTKQPDTLSVLLERCVAAGPGPSNVPQLRVFMQEETQPAGQAPVGGQTGTTSLRDSDLQPVKEVS